MARMQRTVIDVDADEDLDSQILDLSQPNVGILARMTAELSPVGLFDLTSERLAFEQFMEDLLVIEIHTTTDKNAPPVVFVGVNNDDRWCPRGIPIRLQRKFVERLAQSKEARFSTVHNKDIDADNGMNTTRVEANAYGFSVLRDPHPKGREWLRRVSRQTT